MIPGSHNPCDYNGLKMMLSGTALYGEAILALKKQIEVLDFIKGDGSVTQTEVLPAYIKTLTGRITLRPLKIVVDCGHGVSGVLAPTLYKALGCEVVSLYEEVDGRFPVHPPDPGVPENLR